MKAVSSICTEGAELPPAPGELSRTKHMRRQEVQSSSEGLSQDVSCLLTLVYSSDHLTLILTAGRNTTSVTAVWVDSFLTTVGGLIPCYCSSHHLFEPFPHSCCDPVQPPADQTGPDRTGPGQTRPGRGPQGTRGGQRGAEVAVQSDTPRRKVQAKHLPQLFFPL